MKFKIKEFKLGMYMTNCYLVWNENKEGYLFDCGGKDLDSLSRFINEENITMQGLILTHGHYDHIGGINKFKELYSDAVIYIGSEEKNFLTDCNYSLSAMIDGTNFQYLGDFVELKEGDMVGCFETISTPGHTVGSKCFYNKESEILISGDTMFKNSFGRYDLPTGNGAELFKSLKKLCDKYPENTAVYNAHSDVTNLKDEKEFLTMQGYI